MKIKISRNSLIKNKGSIDLSSIQDYESYNVIVNKESIARTMLSIKEFCGGLKNDKDKQ